MTQRSRPLPPEQTELLEDVEARLGEAAPGTLLGALVDEVSALSLECFNEDVVKTLQAQQGSEPPWHLVLLSRRPSDPGAPAVGPSLLGFLVFSMWGPPVRSINILHI